MNLTRDLVAGLVRVLTGISCRIDAPDLAHIPENGPLILAVNHISSLEVPLLMAHLYPRRLIGLAKIETWDNRVMGWLFDLFDAIPIRRGEVDLAAIDRCLEVLKEGAILGVAPEGTRSYDGRLQPGLPGITLLALHADAPILPVVHWGGESFSSNLKKLKRTDFHVRIGRPFKLDPQGMKPHGEMRKGMTNEIMNQMARLMPPAYRGVYADCETAPVKYLNFI